MCEVLEVKDEDNTALYEYLSSYHICICTAFPSPLVSTGAYGSFLHGRFKDVS